MSKIFTSSIAAVILILSASGILSAEDPQKTLTDKMIEGQGMIFARRYDDALKLFQELKREYPDSSGGCFGEMAVYEVRMLEWEDMHLEKELSKASEEGRRRAARIMQKYDPSSWDLFISGALYGLDGFFKARKGQWWDAYVAGNKSRQLFRHVKEIDPKYIDADFGLGMYLYWRSVFTKDLWFLKFFPDRRAEGIAIVENVAKNGHFAKEMAKVNLGIAYFEERRYDDALRVFEEYIHRYPNNVILRRLLGKVFAAKRRYGEAIEQFRAILNVDSSFKKPHYFIGATLVLQGDKANFPEAEKELRYFLSVEKGQYWPASAHYWLGRMREQGEDKDAAKQEYELAYKLDPMIKDALTRARGLGSGL